MASTAIALSVAVTQAATKAFLDAAADAIDVGAGTSVLRVYDGVVLGVSFDLPDPAMGEATLANPSVALGEGLPITGIAAADVDACDNFEVCDGDGTVVGTGSVGLTGSGEAAEMDNTKLAANQNVRLTGLTWTLTIA